MGAAGAGAAARGGGGERPGGREARRVADEPDLSAPRRLRPPLPAPGDAPESRLSARVRRAQGSERSLEQSSSGAGELGARQAAGTEPGYRSPRSRVPSRSTRSGRPSAYWRTSAADAKSSGASGPPGRPRLGTGSVAAEDPSCGAAATAQANGGGRSGTVSPSGGAAAAAMTGSSGRGRSAPPDAAAAWWAASGWKARAPPSWWPRRVTWPHPSHLRG